MAVRKKHDYRLRFTNAAGDRFFVERRNGKVTAVSKTDEPVAFNRITGTAAELRFALEDAFDGRSAARDARLHVPSNTQVAEL